MIARADQRLRSEHLERIRRELRADPQFGFSELSPWSACLARAVRDSDYWHKELTTPATLWLSRAKREQTTRTPSDSRPEGEAGDRPKKKQKRATRHYNSEDKSRKDGDRYTHNRKGVEICRLYGQGKCGTKAAQGKCRNGRSHQCDLCLGPHMASKCPKTSN